PRALTVSSPLATSLPYESSAFHANLLTAPPSGIKSPPLFWLIWRIQPLTFTSSPGLYRLRSSNGYQSRPVPSSSRYQFVPPPHQEAFSGRIATSFPWRATSTDGWSWSCTVGGSARTTVPSAPLAAEPPPGSIDRFAPAIG